MEKYGSPISFMGAGYPNRRKFFAGLLDLPLAVWGTEWELNTPLGQRVKNANRRMAPEEYVKIFLASGINLNLHSSISHPGIDQMKDFVNPRTFEIAACGAFQLTDHRDELPEMFKIGEEIEVFHTVEELRDKIAYYLPHPEKREKIAHAGMRRVLKEHTFVHRLAAMMSAVLPREEERMKQRREKAHRINDADSMIARAKDGELKRFLAPFAGQGPLSLKKVMDEIEKGDGPLTRPEIIFVMIDQIFLQG
jgi:spore maturation protein CgeB